MFSCWLRAALCKTKREWWMFCEFSHAKLQVPPRHEAASQWSAALKNLFIHRECLGSSLTLAAVGRAIFITLQTNRQCSTRKSYWVTVAWRPMIHRNRSKWSPASCNSLLMLLALDATPPPRQGSPAANTWAEVRSVLSFRSRCLVFYLTCP